MIPSSLRPSVCVHAVTPETPKGNLWNLMLKSVYQILFSIFSLYLHGTVRVTAREAVPDLLRASRTEHAVC